MNKKQNQRQEEKLKSSDFEFDTIEYYRLRTTELEHERNIWDKVNLTKYYPTDNLSGSRNIHNPSGNNSTQS